MTPHPRSSIFASMLRRAGAGLVEQKAVAGLCNARNAAKSGGHPGQKAANGHVGMDHIRLFALYQPDKRP